jgi:5,10-methenyltetrahydrofolate synthetase
MAPNDNDAQDDDIHDGYASPPCLMHLVDRDGRLEPTADARQWADVKRWRKAERERLIATRLAIPMQDRRRYSERIAGAVDALLGDVAGRVVTVYWPFRGEPDLLGLIDSLRERGATCALPVVTAPRTPLAFRQWHRGMPVTPGVWNIPVPSDGRDVVPDVVIAPLVGFDPACYRLGHGGGFFDRTLASLVRRPRIIGVGHARLALRTIYPQPHDIAMDVIVTEEGTLARPT